MTTLMCLSIVQNHRSEIILNFRKMTLENNFNLKLREKFLEILVRESKVSSNSTSDQLLFGQVEE